MYGPLLRQLISALAVEIPRTNVKLEERDINSERYRCLLQRPIEAKIWAKANRRANRTFWLVKCPASR